MKLGNTLLFILLAAIWGSSYIFMRALAPILGPLTLACARTLIAGVVLVAFLSALRTKMNWRRNWLRYLFIGAFNTGIPFALLAFAAIRLPTAISVIINALTPLWGAVFAALLLRDRLTARKIFGFTLGVAGVAFIALRGAGLSIVLDPLSLIAAIASTVFYGFSGAVIRRWASDIPAQTMTAASLALAGLALLPFTFLAPPQTVVPISIWAVTVGFALLCSAAAYLIYFHLIAAEGVTAALSVTLVQPLFTFLWSFLFLGEKVTLVILAGAVLVLTGTALVMGGGNKKPRQITPVRSISSFR